jgi:plasmid stabilization system protein ParE
MLRLKFLVGARRDLDDAFNWYCERGEELANDFTDEVDLGLAEIRSDSNCGHIHDDVHRFVLLKRFPYAIYFRSARQVVTIVAVSHTSRDTEYWRDRR